MRCLGLAVLKNLKGAKEKQRFNPKDPKSVSYLAQEEDCFPLSKAHDTATKNLKSNGP